jgi:hypothetical protein
MLGNQFREREKMKRREWYSILFIGCSCLLIVFGTVAMVDGILEVENSQRELWAKIGVALLSFSGGCLFVEGSVRRVMQSFNEAVARRERELGCSLQPEEREAIKEAMRSSASGSDSSLRFNSPLVRIVLRILLVTTHHSRNTRRLC